jgi:hypothetical protein
VVFSFCDIYATPKDDTMIVILIFLLLLNANDVSKLSLNDFYLLSLRLAYHPRNFCTQHTMKRAPRRKAPAAAVAATASDDEL